MRIFFIIVLMLHAGLSYARGLSESDYASKHSDALKLIRTGHSIKAMKYVVEIEKSAHDEGSRYGMYVTNDIKGHLYLSSEEYDEALSHYLGALPLATNVIDSIHVYTDLMEGLRLKGNYDQAEKYLDVVGIILHKNEKRTYITTNSEYIRVVYEFNIQRCFLYYAQGNYKKFNNARNQVKRQTTGDERHRDDEYLIEVYRHIIREEYEDALNACMMYWPNSHFDVRASIYQKMNRYMEATVAWNNNIYYNDTLMSKGQIKDINEISEELGNNKLLAQNQLMAMNNTALQLDFVNLKLGKTKLAFEQLEQQRLLNKAKVEYDKSQIEKSNAELAELKAKNSKERLEKELLENEENREKLIMISSIVVVAEVIILLIVAIYQIRKQHKRLRLKNEQLEVAMRNAEEADKRKRAFFQHISHEVRTPLNAILGFSQILSVMDEKKSEDTDAAYMKGVVLQQMDVMKTLLNDVIGLSVLLNGEVEIEKKDRVVVNKVCQECIEVVKGRCPDNVTIKYESLIPEDYIATVNENSFRLILDNLLTNAEKNTTEGSIVVRAYTDADKLCISVTDTGCGVPENMQEAIFERWVKIDDFKQGFGLGLSLSRDYARLIGDDIILDASYASGARFIYKINLITSAKL